MKIAYLLEDTELAGGTRVAVAHADALTERGHEAVLVTKGGPLTWRRSRAPWQHVRAFEEIDAASFHFVVGTFWTTLAAAHALAGPRAVHLCQGYEGSFTAYQPLKHAIDAAYRLPIPKITVSPHLVPICRAFYDDATYVGQIVDEEFYAAGYRGLGVGGSRGVSGSRSLAANGTSKPRDPETPQPRFASSSSAQWKRISKASMSATTRCGARASAARASI